MLRIGIIGCGKIAQVRHITEYLNNQNVKITALYNVNFQRASTLGEKIGAKAYDSLDELLSSDIDAVSVCSANFAHAQNTIAALNAHKHVLCEKPMAVTLEECEAMVKAASDNKCTLMIDQNQRLARAHVKAKELIEQGVIGKVISFRTIFGHGGPETWSIDPGLNTWFFDKNKASMGAMADLGVHKTDLIQYLLSAKVKSVRAKVCTLDKKYADGSKILVDDNAFCIYEMDNGVIGYMIASWTFYGGEDNSTVIYGTEGVLHIYEDKDYSIVLNLKNGETVKYQLDAIQTNDNQTSSGIIDAFVDCILGKRENVIDGKDVLHAMKTVFCAIESSKSGKKIEV